MRYQSYQRACVCGVVAHSPRAREGPARVKGLYYSSGAEKSLLCDDEEVFLFIFARGPRPIKYVVAQVRQTEQWGSPISHCRRHKVQQRLARRGKFLYLLFSKLFFFFFYVKWNALKTFEVILEEERIYHRRRRRTNFIATK